MLPSMSDLARRVMLLANSEANRLSHEYIGTEHILLGIVALDAGATKEMFRILTVDPRRLRMEVEKLVPSGPKTSAEFITLALTPRADIAVRLADDLAKRDHAKFVGAAHLLIALGAESLQDTVAGAVLRNQNCTQVRLTEALEQVLTEMDKAVSVTQNLVEIGNHLAGFEPRAQKVILDLVELLAEAPPAQPVTPPPVPTQEYEQLVEILRETISDLRKARDELSETLGYVELKLNRGLSVLNKLQK